jgi:hypothetical protein
VCVGSTPMLFWSGCWAPPDIWLCGISSWCEALPWAPGGFWFTRLLCVWPARWTAPPPWQLFALLGCDLLFEMLEVCAWSSSYLLLRLGNVTRLHQRPHQTAADRTFGTHTAALTVSVVLE